MEDWAIKTELIDFIAFTKREIVSFSEGLSEQEKKTRGALAAWAPVDVFNHLVFWGNHFNQQLQMAQEGKKPPVAGDYLDQINDGVFFENADKPFPDSFKEFCGVLDQSEILLSEYSNKDLLNSGLYDYLGNRSILNRALGTIGWHVLFHLSDYLQNSGRLANAADLQETFSAKLKVFPTWEANAIYNLACFYAQIGEEEKAVENLRTAFHLRPDLIEWAKTDKDLDPIRDMQQFKALFINTAKD